MTSPQPWRVERGFSSCRILADDDSVVAEGLTLEDASAIVATMRAVDVARRASEQGRRCARCEDLALRGMFELVEVGR
jgi:hypothetical protein